MANGSSRNSAAVAQKVRRTQVAMSPRDPNHQIAIGAPVRDVGYASDSGKAIEADGPLTEIEGILAQLRMESEQQAAEINAAYLAFGSALKVDENSKDDLTNNHPLISTNCFLGKELVGIMAQLRNNTDAIVRLRHRSML